MAELITPTELPTWVPGKVIAASDGLDWRGLSLRGYRYRGQDVHIPAMRDFMIVSYRQGVTPMERRFDGAWTKTNCAPGSVSLMTRSQKCHWHWVEDIDVTHVYLENELVTALANEALDRTVTEVRLQDLLNVEDPVITGTVAAIEQEAAQGGLGGALYAEALGTQLVLHLLRNYAAIKFKDVEDQSRLSPMQARRVSEYIESRLGEAIDLKSLAACAGLGQWAFTRRFRETFGCAAYGYVITRRVERARHLLEKSPHAIKEIAAACGFSDQAHMTRVFRMRLGVTPAQYRAARMS